MEEVGGQDREVGSSVVADASMGMASMKNLREMEERAEEEEEEEEEG